MLVPAHTFFTCEVLYESEKLQITELLLTPEIFSGFSKFSGADYATINLSSEPILIDDGLIKSYFSTFSTVFRWPSQPKSLINLKIIELLLLLRATHQELWQSDIRDTTLAGSKIYSVISGNISSNISLDELARLSGTSLSSFKREFKRQFNESARKWINKQRLQKACRLLINSQYSIKQIALECGFQHPSYFIKVFRLAYGMTPESYRLSGLLDLPMKMDEAFLSD